MFTIKKVFFFAIFLRMPKFIDLFLIRLILKEKRNISVKLKTIFFRVFALHTLHNDFFVEGSSRDVSSEINLNFLIADNRARVLGIFRFGQNFYLVKLQRGNSRAIYEILKNDIYHDSAISRYFLTKQNDCIISTTKLSNLLRLNFGLFPLIISLVEALIDSKVFLHRYTLITFQSMTKC